jgi:hypothetical protein
MLFVQIAENHAKSIAPKGRSYGNQGFNARAWCAICSPIKLAMK